MAQSAFTQSCVNVAGLSGHQILCLQEFEGVAVWASPSGGVGYLEGVDQHWLVALTRER